MLAYFTEVSEEAGSAGQIHHSGPGSEQGEEEATDGLVGPVVGLHRLPGPSPQCLGLADDPRVVNEDVQSPVLLLQEVS